MIYDGYEIEFLLSDYVNSSSTVDADTWFVLKLYKRCFDHDWDFPKIQGLKPNNSWNNIFVTRNAFPIHIHFLNPVLEMIQELETYVFEVGAIHFPNPKQVPSIQVTDVWDLNAEKFL